MALNESIRQVDAAIRASVERSLDELRGNLQRRLQASNEELVGMLSPATLSLPASLLPGDAIASLEREAGGVARAFSHEELLEQVARLDRCRSQAEILRVLARAAVAHASRAAVLLIDRAGGRGFALEGFGAAADVAALNFSWNQIPQARAASVAEGRHVILLAHEDVQELFGEPTAHGVEEAVLVPLVLRDQVAAVLYADRQHEAAGTGAGLERAALQVLTYVTALGLESLAFRERMSTPTLASSAALAGPGLPLWNPLSSEEVQPPARVAPEQESRRSVVQEPVRAPAQPPITAAIEPVRAVPGEAIERTSDVEALFVDPPAALPKAFEQSLPAIATTEDDFENLPELVLEPLPDFDAEMDPPASAPSFSGFAPPAETIRVPAMTPQPPGVPPSGATTFRVPVQPPAPASGAFDPAEDTTLMLSGGRSRGATAPIPVPGSTPSFDGDETFPGSAPGDGPPNPMPPAATTRPLAEVPASGRGSASGPEVRPPGNVEGPGRAFAAPRSAASGATDAAHEEARRLARLLVSEIKLYNEDQVDQGRRQLDLHERLREDIDRSRQMYEERVDPSVRGSSDYFHQELVRILAGGDARALGQ